VGPTARYKAVYPLLSPVYFLQMAGAARTCDPQYTGIGITMGIDVVANTYCDYGSTGHLHFFSPATAFADSQKFDPGFAAAARRAGVKADDIGWILWGFNKSLYGMVRHAGPNLSKAGFVSALQNYGGTLAGFSSVQYSPSNHFGGRSFNLLENVCTGNGGYYMTKRANLH
jgi:hypothetical protein